jgi:hypothetical protein
MTKALNKVSIFNDEQYTCSSYNEDTNEELDYFIDESNCYVGDTAYLYSKEDDALYEMKIEHIIKRSDNVKFYDSLIENDNVLLDGESEFDADTSAEFITDTDCYLVWFNTVAKVKENDKEQRPKNKIQRDL